MSFTFVHKLRKSQRCVTSFEPTTPCFRSGRLDLLTYYLLVNVISSRWRNVFLNNFKFSNKEVSRTPIRKTHLSIHTDNYYNTITTYPLMFAVNKSKIHPNNSKYKLIVTILGIMNISPFLVYLSYRWYGYFAIW